MRVWIRNHQLKYTIKAENGYQNHHHTFQSKYVIEIEAPM